MSNSESILNYRKSDFIKIIKQIEVRHSVEIIGMKRVGINQFLRFCFENNFFEANNKNYVFIPIDLNDLVERDVKSFWRLVLHRVQEHVLNEEIDKIANSVINDDIFSLVETVRKCLCHISQIGIVPTLFLLRFDRLAGVTTGDFFNNLQGIIDASSQKVSYVFTCHRELSVLFSNSFDKELKTTFSHKVFFKPAKNEDIKIISLILEKKFSLSLSDRVIDIITTYSGGHMQYIHIMFLILYENPMLHDAKEKAIIEAFFSDERIMLQSEELYEHFSDEEKDILKKAYAGNIIYEICKKSAPYLVNTGYIEEQQGKAIIILPCLIEYLQQTSKVTTVESTLTKKEKKLFDLLYENKNKICERDLIIHNVWPECNEIGVSDWAIDRLVSRLRQKLKHAKPTTEIKAIKTRGFILEE